MSTAQLALATPAPLADAPFEAPSPPLPLRWVRELPLAWMLAPLALVKLAAVLRAGIVDIDEADWSVAGRMLGHGAWPYVGFVEKKPLLSFLFYLPAAAAGSRQWVMQLVALGWIFATAVVVGRAAREWTRNDDAGRVASWLYALAACGSIPAVNAETMMNLPAAGALLWFVRAERSRTHRDAFVTGLLVAVASLFKHQAGILLVAFALALGWDAFSKRARASMRLLALFAGFTLPWALSAAVYWQSGHLREFLEWNVWRNLGYAAHTAGSPWARLFKGVALGIVLSAPLHWWLALRESRQAAADPVRRGLVLAFGLTWLPVALGARFYEHYFLQFAPVLAVLAAPGAVALFEEWDELRPKLRAALVAAAALPVLFWSGHGLGRTALGLAPLQETSAESIASWLRENTSPDDRLFVWGHWSPLYYLSDRLPGTRYYTTSVHVGDFDPQYLPAGFDAAHYVSQRDVQQTIGDLEHGKTAIVVDTAPARLHGWDRIPLSAVPALDAYVQSHYRLVAEPAGARVYLRRL
jgi:hypothetical protein